MYPSLSFSIIVSQTIESDKNINIIHHYYNSQFVVEWSNSTTIPNQILTHSFIYKQYFFILERITLSNTFNKHQSTLLLLLLLHFTNHSFKSFQYLCFIITHFLPSHTIHLYSSPTDSNTFLWIVHNLRFLSYFKGLLPHLHSTLLHYYKSSY